MRILHLDTNHPLLIQQLDAIGFVNHEDYTSSKGEIETKISEYDGLIIRSRFSIDKQFIEKATRLKFIGRVGAGIENIDSNYAQLKDITLLSAPEGNRNAVAEHALGMLLSLFNNLKKADTEVRMGLWNRESNRGVELDGKTVGIIGYGNMGKSFAQKLKGFNVEVLCYDIAPNVGDDYARQVTLKEFRSKVDVVSLHTPQTVLTVNMINTEFIKAFKKSFWLINTARGKSLVTEDLVVALKNGKILGVALDVLEYESKDFESIFANQLPAAFQYLLDSDRVLLSPHVGGWTKESYFKLSDVLADKIISFYQHQ